MKNTPSCLTDWKDGVGRILSLAEQSKSEARLGPSSHVAAVDILRGLSALAIVVFHVRVELWVGWREIWNHPDNYSFLDRVCAYLSLPAPFLGHAVMMFFIISGFCIHYPYVCGKRPLRLGTYGLRRLLRIYPPYLVVVFVSLLLEKLLFRYFERTGSDLSKFGESLLMIQNYGSSPGQISSNPSLWSLPVEMELYLVFPLFYWLASRLGMRSILTIVALVSLLGLGLYLTGAEWMMANFIKYWIIWCSGTLLAEWVASGRVPNWSLRSTVTTLLFLFVAAGALLAGVSTAVQHFLWACFYFMAFWFLLSLPIPSANYTSLPFRLLSGLGTISYSLYLVHYPFFRLSGTLWLSHFEDKPANFLIPLAFSVAAVGVAVLFYGIVERPSHSISRALSRRLGVCRTNLVTCEAIERQSPTDS